jgi:FkbH-like protein
MDRERLDRVRAAADSPSLFAALRGVDATSLSGREVDVIARSLDRLPPGSEPLRVALLGNHTMDPLATRLSVHAAVAGTNLQTLVAPWGQYAQAVLDRGSGLHEFQPRLMFLSLAMRALSPAVHGDFPGLSMAAREAERDRILAHIDDWVRAALAATNSLLLIANFQRPVHNALGTADAREPLGEAEFYLTLNLELLRRYRQERRVCIVDVDRLALGFGADRAFSERLYHMAKLPWTEGFLARLAHELMRYVLASRGLAKKCLVVDLDNTLWGGVVGEDGAQAIEIGSGSPTGEAYEAFQRVIKGIQAQGVVLAICSKNNPADVDEAFAAHPDMPLRRSDFVAEQVSWDPKPAGIAAIADALGIGIDSMAFVDDNPAEREIVRHALPDVAVIDLPADPADYADALRRQVLFDRLDVTAEDRARSGHYAQQAERQRFESATYDLPGYLAGLGTELVVRSAAPSDLARLHQLFTKTNQFNLTSRRYSPAEIERFLADEQCDLGIARMRDRFGDLGVIALYLVHRESGCAEIDSFVMSCRALGRDAETAFMNWLKERHAGGSSPIAACFIPTPRNAPARDFLERQGFRLIAETPDGSRRYELDPDRAGPIACPHIALSSDPA